LRRIGTRLAGAAILALALAASACDRTPQLLPASADSTKASPDTFAILANQAADQWDAGNDQQGSALSARVLLEGLKLRPSTPWPQRVKTLLDSLGVAAEVEGDGHLLVVNMFSRALGADASFPYLYWRDGGPRVQTLEGTDLHLSAVAGRGFKSDGQPSDTAQVAVLFGRRAGAGLQPIVMVWGYATGGRWNLEQTLGPDSLGGTGNGQFSPDPKSPVLDVRTYEPTPYFEECATCPHVYHERTFAWGSKGFTSTTDQLVPSPYTAFTAFITALVAGDRVEAARHVTDPSLIDFAIRFEWQVPGRGRWRLAPISDESASAMTFLRGANDAYRVAFEARDGDWVVAGFEPTIRPVE